VGGRRSQRPSHQQQMLKKARDSPDVVAIQQAAIAGAKEATNPALPLSPEPMKRGLGFKVKAKIAPSIETNTISNGGGDVEVDPSTKLEELSLLRVIGKGSFGSVYIATSPKLKGRSLALKKMLKSTIVSNKDETRIFREKEALQAMKGCPFIINLEATYNDKECLYFLTECVQGGNLMSYMIEKDILTHSQAQFATLSAAMAIAYVHKMGYVHRDIKPENLLIDGKGYVVLCDFGFAVHLPPYTKASGGRAVPRSFDSPTDGAKTASVSSSEGSATKNGEVHQVYSDSSSFSSTSTTPGGSERTTGIPLFGEDFTTKANYELARTMCGTPEFMAPEIVMSKRYDKSVDWWALGCIVIEMYCGRGPFDYGEDLKKTFKKICLVGIGRTEVYIPQELKVPGLEDTVDFIQRLVCTASKRIGRGSSSPQVLQHSYFNGIDQSKVYDKTWIAPYIPEVRGKEDSSHFKKEFTDMMIPSFQEESGWADGF
jgi:serine/threonine protein kinase